MGTTLKAKGKITALTTTAIASILLMKGLATPVSAASTVPASEQSINSTSRLEDKVSQPVIDKIVLATKIITGAGILIGTGVSIKYDKKFKNRLHF